MRVNVGKYLFIGRNKSEFFSACRDLGVIQFISKRNFLVSDQIRRFSDALKILGSVQVEDPSLAAARSEKLSLDQVLDEIFSLNQEIGALTEQVKALNKEIVRVKPLGAFSSEENKEFSLKTGLTIRFFYRRHVDGQELEVAQENVFYLSTAYNFDYYVVIGLVDLPKDLYIEMEAPRSVNELQQEAAQAATSIHRKRSRLSELYAYRQDILEGLCEYDNEQRLQHAENSSEDVLEGRMFYVLGWVLYDRIRDVEELCAKYEVYVEAVAPDPDEIVPTHLDNTGFSRMGEDLVNIYDAPASTDKDPSGWVFISFFFFFSMIVNDAGYGLVFLAIALFLMYKLRLQMKASKALARFLKMFAILGVGCIAWGAATTSFFGVSVSCSNPIREYSLTHALALKKAAYYLKEQPKAYRELVADHPSLKEKQTPKDFLLATSIKDQEGIRKPIVYDKFIDSILLEIALLVGAIHMGLGMLRYGLRRYSGFGWVIFICGAYLYLPSYLQSTSLIHYALHVPYDLGGIWGLYMMAVGLGAAVLGAMLQRGWRGIDELSALIQVFSDVLSYLRIYALGLAGAMVGGTVMQMGSRFSPLIAFVIISFGHSVNITLSIMSGVIHGLRLNFIEWYHYSFDGGGKLFQPLKRRFCHKAD